MPVEIREIIIRTEISVAGKNSVADTGSKELKAWKKQLLDECKRMVIDNNKKQLHKRELMDASLQLMTITAYTDENFQTALANGSYTVMMNPESIKWQRSIEYNEVQAPDTNTPSQKYKCTPSDKLNFDLVIDCMGIVNSSRTDMPTEIAALQNIMYTYNGSIHRPNFVQIRWGANLTFSGVLTSFDISYTLFRPDGTPLRAKISLGFNQYISPELAEQLKSKQSPDVSHRVTVEDGMTLPQLCMKVWKDDSYYVQVARHNNLNKFRNLKGIRQLIFPPVISHV